MNDPRRSQNLSQISASLNASLSLIPMAFTVNERRAIARAKTGGSK